MLAIARLRRHWLVAALTGGSQLPAQCDAHQNTHPNAHSSHDAKYGNRRKLDRETELDQIKSSRDSCARSEKRAELIKT